MLTASPLMDAQTARETRKTPEDRATDYAELLAGESQRDRNVELFETLADHYERLRQIDRDYDAKRTTEHQWRLVRSIEQNALFGTLGACRDRVGASQVTAGYFPNA